MLSFLYQFVTNCRCDVSKIGKAISLSSSWFLLPLSDCINLLSSIHEIWLCQCLLYFSIHFLMLCIANRLTWFLIVFNGVWISTASSILCQARCLCRLRRCRRDLTGPAFSSPRTSAGAVAIEVQLFLSNVKRKTWEAWYFVKEVDETSN